MKSEKRNTKYEIRNNFEYHKSNDRNDKTQRQMCFEHLLI